MFSMIWPSGPRRSPEPTVPGSRCGIPAGSRFAAALDENSSTVERVQENGQAGPCAGALRCGEVVTVADLGEAAGGWGAYGQAAREAGS